MYWRAYERRGLVRVPWPLFVSAEQAQPLRMSKCESISPVLVYTLPVSFCEAQIKFDATPRPTPHAPDPQATAEKSVPKGRVSGGPPTPASTSPGNLRTVGV